MSRCRLLLLSAVLSVVACAGAGAPVNTPERKERIVEHIKERYKELAPIDLVLSDFTRVGGLDQASMTMRNGEGPKQLVLVTPDDKQVYLVMGEVIDASASIEGLRAERKKEQAARAVEVEKLAQGRPVRGNPEAPVTVIEFSDFQCPYCRRGAESVEQLLAAYPKQVKLVFMHYPLPFHPWAKPAAIAAECAARQDPQAFWTLHDAYFAAQDQITPENVMERSEQVLAKAGLDVKKWSSCAKEQTPERASVEAAVDASMAAGQKLGVEGTPAFFIEGELIGGAVPMQELERVVKGALKEAS